MCNLQNAKKRTAAALLTQLHSFFLNISINVFCFVNTEMSRSSNHAINFKHEVECIHPIVQDVVIPNNTYVKQQNQI